MIPEWSDKHPNKRAQKIYNDAFWRFVGFGVLALIPVPVLISILVDWSGLPDWVDPFQGIFGVGIPILMLIANLRGVGALRRAGLVREATETIARAQVVARGEPLEFRKSVGSKLGGAAFFMVLAVASWFVRQMKPADALAIFAGTAGVLVFGAFALLFLINIHRPLFRVDDEGIFVCADWLFPRFVSWERIAYAQFYRVWGLQPTFSIEANPADTVWLRDKANKILLRLDFATFYEAPPAVKNQFIAELKRRLRGDEVTEDAEANDG